MPGGVAEMQYQCATWQGLIQELVYLVGRGYYFYCIVPLNFKKCGKNWAKTDKKLIKKYEMNISKFQRARKKKKGKSNFYYLRWQHVAIMLHTAGDVDSTVYNDRFLDLRERQKKIVLKISDLIWLQINLGAPKNDNKRHIEVRLYKDSYNGFKDNLERVIQLKNKEMIFNEFNKINGIPAWAGIIKQKQLLYNFMLRKCKSNSVKLNNEDKPKIRILTKRNVVKVFNITEGSKA